MLPFHWMIKHKNNTKGTIYRSDFVDSQMNKTEEIRRKKENTQQKCKLCKKNDSSVHYNRHNYITLANVIVALTMVKVNNQFVIN